MNFKAILCQLGEGYLRQIYQGQTDLIVLEQHQQKILNAAEKAWEAMSAQYKPDLENYYNEWIQRQSTLQQGTRLLVTFAQTCLMFIASSGNNLGNFSSTPSQQVQQAQLADIYLMALYHTKTRYPELYQSKFFQTAISTLYSAYQYTLHKQMPINNLHDLAIMHKSAVFNQILLQAPANYLHSITTQHSTVLDESLAQSHQKRLQYFYEVVQNSMSNPPLSEEEQQDLKRSYEYTLQILEVLGQSETTLQEFYQLGQQIINQEHTDIAHVKVQNFYLQQEEELLKKLGSLQEDSANSQDEFTPTHKSAIQIRAYHYLLEAYMHIYNIWAKQLATANTQQLSFPTTKFVPSTIPIISPKPTKPKPKVSLWARVRAWFNAAVSPSKATTTLPTIPLPNPTKNEFSLEQDIFLTQLHIAYCELTILWLEGSIWISKLIAQQSPQVSIAACETAILSDPTVSTFNERIQSFYKSTALWGHPDKHKAIYDFVVTSKKPSDEELEDNRIYLYPLVNTTNSTTTIGCSLLPSTARSIHNKIEYQLSAEEVAQLPSLQTALAQTNKRLIPLAEQIIIINLLSKIQDFTLPYRRKAEEIFQQLTERYNEWKKLLEVQNFEGRKLAEDNHTQEGLTLADLISLYKENAKKFNDTVSQYEIKGMKDITSALTSYKKTLIALHTTREARFILEDEQEKHKRIFEEHQFLQETANLIQKEVNEKDKLIIKLEQELASLKEAVRAQEYAKHHRTQTNTTQASDTFSQQTHSHPASVNNAHSVPRPVLKSRRSGLIPIPPPRPSLQPTIINQPKQHPAQPVSTPALGILNCFCSNEYAVTPLETTPRMRAH